MCLTSLSWKYGSDQSGSFLRHSWRVINLQTVPRESQTLGGGGRRSVGGPTVGRVRVWCFHHASDRQPVFEHTIPQNTFQVLFKMVRVTNH